MFDKCIFSRASSLEEIAEKYPSDKSKYIQENGVTYRARDLLRHYEFFLSHLRYEKFTFVELGCFQGNSLRLWREYFQKAHIIGVDINPEYIIKEDRIECIKANVIEEDLTAPLLKYSEKYGKIYCK